MEIEILLEELKSKVKRKDAKRNLDAIYKACSELRNQGVHNFSISNVARFGKEFGVPQEQSLRNSKNSIALIKAFQSEVKPNKRSRKHRQGTDSWIDELDNPRHQILARKLRDDLKKAEEQIQEMKPLNNTITVHESSGMNNIHLSNVEYRALQYLISDEFYSDHSLSKGESGEVLDPEGKIVMKVGTVDAFKKVLDSL